MSELVAFKFRAVNEYLLDSLRQNYVYFSNPEQLNDPFDCRVNIAKAFDDAISVSSGKTSEVLQLIASAPTLFDQIQTDILKFGVLSLAPSLTSSVMWSQYADEHRGICLTYNFPEQFTIDAENQIIGRAPVSYEPEPITKWLVENALTVDPDDPRGFAIGLMKKLLTVKAEEWGYEGEYRLIRMESGRLEIASEYLSQVCLGLRTTADDQAKVEAALDEAGSKASRVRMTKSSSNFGLVAVEI